MQTLLVTWTSPLRYIISPAITIKIWQYLWHKCQYVHMLVTLFGPKSTGLQPSSHCNLLHWNQVNLKMKVRLLSPLHSPHTDTKLYFVHSHPTQYFFSPFTGKNTRRAQGSRAALRRTHNTPSNQHRLSQLPKLHFFPPCLLIFLVHKQRSITAQKLLTLHINEILAKVSFQFPFYNILNPVKSCHHWYPQHNAWFHSFTVSYCQSDIYSWAASLLYVKWQEKKNCVQSTARLVATFLILSELIKEALCLMSWLG